MGLSDTETFKGVTAKHSFYSSTVSIFRPPKRMLKQVGAIKRLETQPRWETLDGNETGNKNKAKKLEEGHCASDWIS